MKYLIKITFIFIKKPALIKTAKEFLHAGKRYRLTKSYKR